MIFKTQANEDLKRFPFAPFIPSSGGLRCVACATGLAALLAPPARSRRRKADSEQVHAESPLVPARSSAHSPAPPNFVDGPAANRSIRLSTARLQKKAESWFSDLLSEPRIAYARDQNY